MNEYVILCVDDEQEVLNSLVADLECLSARFDIELAESADDAKAIIEELQQQDQSLALVLCDHMMPGMMGVDLLIELSQQPYTDETKKLLITGQAALQDTIRAVNQAGLDHYIAKPWDKADLLKTVIKHLTDYILEYDEQPYAYADILDSERIFASIHQNS